MAIILKVNKVNLFVYSVSFVFWYDSPNILDTPRMVITTHHATRHNTPIHNFLSTAPQLSVSQKVLGTLPDDGNVMPKPVGATIYNSINWMYSWRICWFSRMY
jgi:hypothetical protein